jgi:hypothetical protein
MSMVFFTDGGGALWVSDIKMDAGVIEGWVINGHWHVVINPLTKTIGVKDDPDHWTYSELRFIEVQDDDQHYEDVIAWARKELAIESL